MNPLSTRPNRWRPITVFNLLVGLIFSLSALAQPAFLKEGLVAYFPFNGNANDESGNGNHGIANTVEWRDSNNENNGKSVFLTGGATVRVKHSASLSFPKLKPFTISLWVNPSSTYGHILGKRSAVQNCNYQIIFDNGKLFFHGDPYTSGLGSGNLLQMNKWSHILCTWDGFTSRVFVDGRLSATGTGANSTPLGTENTADLLIGGSATFDRYSGGIDSLRIYNRALSDGEVKGLYDYEFTPPDNRFITNGLVAYYQFNGNSDDASGNGNAGLQINTLPIADRFNNQSSALAFNGKSSKVTIQNKILDMGLDGYTINFWFSPYSLDQKLNGTSEKGGGVLFNSNSGVGIAVGFTSYTAPQNAEYKIGGVGWDMSMKLNNPGAKKDYAVNQWYMATLVKNGGTYTFFINSDIQDRQSNSKSYSLKDGFIVGSSLWNEYFEGAIDDVRIYNKTLSDGEVKALYDYESTPPQNNLNPRTATATAQVVNGFVVGATITDAGYGYESNPVVTITGGGGTGAKATATQSNGVVTSITITNPGSGYTGTPTITIAPPPFPPRKATSTAEIVNGFVVGTKITDGGFGYDSPPTVLIVGGGGSGATAIATVANSVVTAIIITNPGTGYTSAPLVRIASPPFAPKLGIETSKVYVRMSVVLGRKYQLEASTDLNTWTTTGPAFIAQDEELAQEFDVNQVGRYFRINQVP